MSMCENGQHSRVFGYPRINFQIQGLSRICANPVGKYLQKKGIPIISNLPNLRVGVI